MSIPLKTSDPAYWMLQEGINDHSKCSKTTVYKDDCYICNDPEFSLMGLPLCFKCLKCGGHVAADSSTCDNCGIDQDDCIDQ